MSKIPCHCNVFCKEATCYERLVEWVKVSPEDWEVYLKYLLGALIKLSMKNSNKCLQNFSLVLFLHSEALSDLL